MGPALHGITGNEFFIRESHPHPTYVALDARLRDLAQGPHGERAGDVVLIAHNGDREAPEDRYYFAERYRSWHGSPSRQDSEIPLIVANASRLRPRSAGSCGRFSVSVPFSNV